ncbi:MAG: hypothetical protein GTO46_09235 [Gemmatimonadetes bacterium]|nr:hypothetical protein [Gemmatimonadota bacterium]NIO31798.1 hypothetical protein [Gemmatimonadota bacterium]
MQKGSLIALVLLVGCVSATEPTNVQVSLDVEFQLSLGQVAELEGSGLRIEFEAVPQDSRCPPYALCFWAGDALVELEAWEVGLPEWRRQDLALHTNPSVGPAQASYGIHAVQLLELEPSFSSPVNPPYVVTLRIVELSVG